MRGIGAALAVVFAVATVVSQARAEDVFVFYATGGSQDYTVPVDAIGLHVKLWGAGGGGGGGSLGGGGGFASGIISVTADGGENFTTALPEVLLGIVVATGNTGSTGGVGGGGNGMGNPGGGGYSSLYMNYPSWNHMTFIVAGGGGAGAAGFHGGAGGGLVGGDSTGAVGRGGGTPGHTTRFQGESDGGGGGGGGMYGGGAGSLFHPGGGGGSSFIYYVEDGVTIAGFGDVPGNIIDPDYIAYGAATQVGYGAGGVRPGSNGGNGMVIIRPIFAPVNVSAAPEPSSAVLAVGVAIPLVAVVRRRKGTHGRVI